MLQQVLDRLQQAFVLLLALPSPPPAPPLPPHSEFEADANLEDLGKSQPGINDSDDAKSVLRGKCLQVLRSYTSCLLDSGNPQKALQVIHQALEIAPDPVTLNACAALRGVWTEGASDARRKAVTGGGGGGPAAQSSETGR